MDYLALLKTPLGRRILLGILKEIDTAAEVSVLLSAAATLPQMPAAGKAAINDETGRRYVTAIVLGITAELNAAKDPAADVEALMTLARSFTAQPAAKKRA